MEQPELDERKAAILKAVVEEYVETAQPVGSQAIARAAGLGVSSATVRNEMTVLERDGYLHQPHTSAGRVPTDQGYRFFVDHFAPTGGLPAGQKRHEWIFPGPVTQVEFSSSGRYVATVNGDGTVSVLRVPPPRVR